MIVGQTHGELLQFYSAHLSTSQRRLVSLFSQKFCRCALAVENCSFFHICLCASQGNCLVCFCQKIRPCASHEESCSFFVQHMLVCITGEAVADFYTKSGNVHHDCTCKGALNMCRNNGSDKRRQEPGAQR